jgi:hypothetical protein
VSCDECLKCSACPDTICDECHDLPVDGDCVTIAGDNYHRICADWVVASRAAEVREFVAQLVVTDELSVYDPAEHYAPSPDEYANGAKFAHTRRAIVTANRHECTNYDELCKQLDQHDYFDQAIYSALRARANELVGAEDLLGPDLLEGP